MVKIHKGKVITPIFFFQQFDIFTGEKKRQNQRENEHGKVSKIEGKALKARIFPPLAEDRE